MIFMKTKKVSREEEARRKRVLYWTIFVIAINIPQLFFKNIFIEGFAMIKRIVSAVNIMTGRADLQTPRIRIKTVQNKLLKKVKIYIFRKTARKKRLELKPISFYLGTINNKINKY